MSKVSESTSIATFDDIKGVQKKNVSSLRSHRDKCTDFTNKNDSPSNRSESPQVKGKKRHKKRAHKRSASSSPSQEDRDSQKYDDKEIEACHCLGVFGLSSHTEERDLREVFSTFGDIDKLCLIYDKQTGQSKGFGFVYFKKTADAIIARKETQGLVLGGRHIRVDYSFTLQPHPSTPGKYKGHRRCSYGYRTSSYRHSDDYGYRSRHRDNTYDDHYYKRRSERDNYDDNYYKRRSVRNDYDDDFHYRSSRKYSPYYRRH